MELIIGCVTIFGLLTGIYTLLKIHKVYGILQLILAAICPIITILFCSLKTVRAFGGTDWEFLVHSATIDGDILPWMILVLFVIEFVFIIKTILVVFRNSNG